MSKVSLVGMTKPSSITGCYTAEQLVAYTARVSNPENQNNTKTAPKAIATSESELVSGYLSSWLQEKPCSQLVKDVKILREVI